ncbi:MAG: MBL fold metallo-hydrolase [Oscillospiraceae bacterium]
MEIIWHGHSCFELVSGGYSLVLDPYYHRELCVYPELRLTADAVLCSHRHYGHGWTEAVACAPGRAGPL